MIEVVLRGDKGRKKIRGKGERRKERKKMEISGSTRDQVHTVRSAGIDEIP
jgi:hypothetical protein